MSLIARPAVLFLDEPTTGLDPRSRLAMWELIEELARDGTTTLLTTQYLEEADRLAEEIIVIDHGSVIARGTAGELKRDLGGERVEIELRDAARRAARRSPSWPTSRAGTEVFDERTRRLCIPVYDARGVVPTVVRRLDAVGVEVRGRRGARGDPRRRVPLPHRPQRGGVGRRRRRVRPEHETRGGAR